MLLLLWGGVYNITLCGGVHIIYFIFFILLFLFIIIYYLFITIYFI